MKANVINGTSLQFTPFDETKEWIEITEEQHDQIIEGRLIVQDGALVVVDNFDQKQYAKKRIAELKQLLKDYDYIGTKIATGRGTREEYATEIAQMTSWANEINDLEAVL